MSVKRYATTNHFLHRCIDEHSPTPENENKINELFVVRVSMHRGMHRECRGFRFARLDRESFKFYFFFFPLSFLSFLFFPCFLPFFFLSFFFQLSAIKSFPSFSIRFRSRNRSFPLLLLQKKKEKREKRDRTLFPLPLVFIELFNRVFRERAILFFARCFSRSRETSRK